MSKISITLAFICFTLLVLPNSSNSRYLLVELDGAPDMDPGMDGTTEEPGMPEPEEEPTNDLEPEPLPEDEKEDVMPEKGEKRTFKLPQIRSLNHNATSSLVGLMDDIVNEPASK